LREAEGTAREGERRGATRGPEDVYLPSDDTSTLAQVLTSYSGARCLEIGFGSGAILRSLTSRFGLVVGTDVLSVAQAIDARGDAEVVLADRATCFRPGTFDLIAFNPPYLPSEAVEDAAVDGGEGGLEVPLAFLEDALRVLRTGGAVVLLLSDEADLEAFRRTCESKGLRVEEKARRRLFYETLVVFSIQGA
jgi:release factor glutamine methyltransferase